MLHRTSKGAFGGMWVFPGGRVDDDDRRPDDDGDEPAARRAAAREATEECGLAVDPDEIVAFSRWTPPPVAPKRFATWFFLARVPTGDVVVDGGEIVDHRWLAPSAVLEQRDRGEVELAPPTWMTLNDAAGGARRRRRAGAGRGAAPDRPLRDALVHGRRGCRRHVGGRRRLRHERGRTWRAPATGSGCSTPAGASSRAELRAAIAIAAIRDGCGRRLGGRCPSVAVLGVVWALLGVPLAVRFLQERRSLPMEEFQRAMGALQGPGPTPMGPGAGHARSTSRLAAG